MSLETLAAPTSELFGKDVCMCVSVCVVVAQLCLTLCDPMDYSLPSSSVHGILQARILGELPFPSPGDLPNPGIKLRSPTLQADALPSEPPGNYIGLVWGKMDIK